MRTRRHTWHLLPLAGNQYKTTAPYTTPFRCISEACLDSVLSTAKLCIAESSWVKGAAAALQRGIEIRVIIDKPDEEKLLSNIVKHLKKFPTFKIKYLLNAPKALISVYDKGEA